MISGLAVCAGVGGLELSLDLALTDYRTVCYVEREAYAAAALVARMADGTLDPAPIWDDLFTFDGASWRGLVDIVTAGFPCQPWSAAGKGDGTADERWIWPDIRDRIREADPWLVWLENVPPLISRGGLALVLWDLDELGFDAEWGTLRASDVGASHQRERVYILAHRNRERLAQLRTAYDDDGGDAPGHDVDGRSARLLADRPNNGRQRRATGQGRGQHRPEHTRPAVGDAAEAGLSIRPGHAETSGHAGATGASADVADTARDREHGSPRQDRRRRRGVPQAGDDLVDAACSGERDGREDATAVRSGRQHEQAEPQGSGPRDVADASSGALRIEPERDQRDRRGVRAAEREHAEPGPPIPLFPPAPSDLDRWRSVLADRFDLAPAVTPADEDRLRQQGAAVTQTEAQPAIRGMAHGTTDRVDRLRACGNGVVPLPLAYAFLALRARALKD